MKGVIFIIMACILWALDTLIRYPLLWSGTSAESIVFVEHLFLTLIFVYALYHSRAKFLGLKLKGVFYFFVIGGLGSAIGTLAFTKAFAIINPSLVILLQKLQPLVAITFAYFFLKERMKKEFFIWSIPCLIGGALISYGDISKGLAGSELSISALFQEGALFGYALTLLAVVSWGASTVFGKKLSLQGFSEIEIMAGRFATGFICLLPVALTLETKTLPHGELWGKIFAMVVISGLLGMYFYYNGLKRISARLCALAEMFFPFCAVAINWIVLGKELTMIQLLGGALLLLGSTVIQIKHY